MIKPDLLGSIDISSGILLLYTVSAVPALFADIHAFFLIFKGVISHVRLPQPMLPIMTLGTAADLISAAIIYFGSPPIFGQFKIVIAGALFIKGIWSLLITLAA